jgi:release factor glutamine methyltransferase
MLRDSKSFQTLGTLLQTTQIRLSSVSETPRLDAELLLARVLNQPRSYLYAWPDRATDAGQERHFMALLERRLAGEPVAYLTGWRAFWSLDLVVTPATLIPRPETELLVELALERLPADQPRRVADLGTGSGAIALAIASERPTCQVVATDLSVAALRVAGQNAQRLGIGNVQFRQGDWCAALTNERFDTIVCNPPYIAATDPHLQQGDLRFEPHPALAAGVDGLAAIRRIVAQAGPHLVDGGWLLLEHGYDQRDSVLALLRTAGFSEVADYRDLAGQPRVAVGRLPAV